MNDLRKAMVEYLAIRRSLGFKLIKVEATLRNFVAFAQKEGGSHISIDLVLRWLKVSTAKESATLADDLSIVRRFAIWRSVADAQTEIPPKNLLPYRYHRKPPYIYSDEEIEKIVGSARNLPSAKGLRGLTYATLFGLLATTGMRISEALALDREDVDLKEKIVIIRKSKFRKSRLVPLHISTSDILENYVKERDRILSRPKGAAFFVSEQGTRVTQWATRDNFAKVSREIGLREKIEGRRIGSGPRLHDMLYPNLNKIQTFFVDS